MTISLLAALLAQNHTIPLHTPGHQRGRGTEPLLRALWGMALAQDLSELPGLDNLAQPTGVLAEAQAAVAATAGSDRAWFLVNGATSGLLAALLATVGPGDRVLVGRNVHRSVIAGLVLTGAKPVYLGVAVDPQWGLPLPVTRDVVAAGLAAYPDTKAVVLVSPTYEGLCSPLVEIAQCVHDHGLPLIVDEAHGSHFAYHPALPVAALAAGADVVVQSWHKTLGTLTQTAVLHLKGERVSPERLSQALNLVQTTSPSYWFLAALERAGVQMAEQGEQIYARLLQWVKTSEWPLPRWQPTGIPQDPLRLTLGTWPIGLTGFALDELLQPQIIAEFPSGRSLTFCLGLGTSQIMLEILADRLKSVCAEYCYHAPLPPLAIPPIPNRQEPALSPRDAYFCPQASVPLKAALNEISAETLSPYPPGIPAVIAGERITASVIETLQTLQELGAEIVGATDPTLQTLRICRV
ncbi:aminotransferase class I/II-fold pyridoxal phosphate-dependent enzyme [Thermosynechococcus sp. B1]|uniref:aminotransferase class I/II-fold pyridoxal phosphate-dependent enzyme n=1 Tax=Thermosynechococcus sp. B1 TaxID=2937792 RepID=UPI0025761CCC|nr:aminotransferase class I/II-fold pyridoxal phosphate-dependent enzyme [Thermosynechococcus sp. B1]WJI27765.1 aminotransferase class I/II-fold pyridoxal phosphate-dependent enzyme [Thermosynechococcus sp. B1]